MADEHTAVRNERRMEALEIFVNSAGTVSIMQD